MDNDLKMLFQVNQGDIIHVTGRLLQPFCSHALYRVRVTDLHNAGHGYMVIQGTLVDFKDSPVKSYALSRVQFFRWEDPAKQSVIQLSREDIERVVRAQGVSVGFHKEDGAIRVDTWKTKQGGRYRLGKLSAVAQMSEEDLASLVRTKFGIGVQEEAEKVEIAP